MSFRTILSIALASALIAGATTAYAAARGEVYKAPPVVNGDRVSASGFPLLPRENNTARYGGTVLLPLVGPSQYRDHGFPSLPLVGVVDQDPPLAGDTPGIELGPEFSPDGKASFEIKLACVTLAPEGIKVINVGEAAVPAGLKLRWTVKAAGAAGSFVLPGALGVNQTLLVMGYDSGMAGESCGIKLVR